ncbi:MAG: hypothetical protein HDT40_06120 [Lachnospiraceae bacterium]|nr:hypothetical protein [Lachnospiraceae bacterium]
MDDFGSMMGFDKLNLYFEVHVAGFDGECFNYSVYLEDGYSDDKLKEIDTAINEFIKPYNDKEIDLGYVDVSKEDEKVNIYLDTGNVEPEDIDTAITGIVKALNNVSGIKNVIVNEDCDFDF